MFYDLDEQSPLTTHAILLFYYGLGLLGFIMGFTGLLALMGALVSRTTARKEKFEFAERHCTWIVRTICFGYTIFSLALLGLVFILWSAYPEAPLLSMEAFDLLWSKPELHTYINVVKVLLSVVGITILWVLYRIFRGGYMLLHSRFPGK